MNEPCTPITPKRVVEKDFMRVYCRLKPILPGASSCIEVISDTMVKLLTKHPSKPKCYKFKRVFTETKTQQEIFNEVALPLIEQLVSGKNGLLLTYGVTNSGKTYTMTGTRQDIGILPRCLDVLFNSIRDFQAKRFTFKPNRANKFIVQTEKKSERDRNKVSIDHKKHDFPDDLPSTFDKTDTKVTIEEEYNAYAVFVTYVEVYNNLVYDLLEDTLNEPYSKAIRVDASGNMFVHGVTEVEVKTAQEAFELFRRGQKRRLLGVTRSNINSSRSHRVFNIRLVQAPLDDKGEEVLQDNEKICISQLSLVDLAGSERTRRKEHSGVRLEEGSRINLSLLSLRKCLRDLREKQTNPSAKVHVSYRECKIMFMLKSFFENGGDCRMIACINPDISDAEENACTMQFAEASQDIVIKATPKIVGHSLGLTPGRRRINQAYKRTSEMLEEIREHDLPISGVSPGTRCNQEQCYKDLQQKIQDLKEEHKRELGEHRREIEESKRAIAKLRAEVNEFKKQFLRDFFEMKNTQRGESNAAQNLDVFPMELEVSQKSVSQLFRCDKCDEHFQTRYKLKQHSRIHFLEMKPYVCNDCGKMFTQKCDLERHVRIHLNIKPYKCNYCSKTFTVKANLDTHVRIHLNIRPYKCDHCTKKFTYKSVLDSHVRIHLNIKPYKCNHCSKKFTEKSNLERHVRIHLNIKPYKCNYCSKTFTVKANLDSHVRIHLNIRPYKCDHCNKKFIQKHHLNSHTRTHLNILPYECNYCSKIFTNKCNLISHIRTHMASKLFECDQCSKKFVSPSNLKKHAKVHSSTISYQCDICESKFKRKCNLNHHVIHVHGLTDH